MFACLLCQTHHFLGGVVEAEKVRGLASREARERFVDLQFVAACPTLFTQLDQQWVCSGCHAAVDQGNMPALAARNGLPATWASLPPSLLTLSQEELEVVDLTQVCRTVHGLTVGVAGPGNPSKKLLIPLKQILHAPRLLEQEHRPEQVLNLHSWPPEQQTILRGGLVMQAWSSLLVSHPSYVEHEGSRHSSMFHMRALVEKHEGQQAEKVARRTLVSIVLPDLKPSVPGGQALLQARLLDRSSHGLYDLMQQAGQLVPREVPITDLQHIQHLLSHVHRLGPANSASLVLCLLAEREAHMLSPLTESPMANSQTCLINHRGSCAYYWKIQQDLHALSTWCGPAVFSFTLAFHGGSLDMLGTRVSHLAGVEGRDEQVWHCSSEKERLTLRPGQEIEQGQGDHWVHRRTGRRNGSCPYHQYCDRSPLAECSQRWLHLISLLCSHIFQVQSDRCRFLNSVHDGKGLPVQTSGSLRHHHEDSLYWLECEALTAGEEIKNDVFNPPYQVLETAPLSGLPHLHSVLWADLDPALSELLSLLQTGATAHLTREQLEPVVALGQQTLTVATTPAVLLEQFPSLTPELAEEVVRLTMKFQVHHCTPSCTSSFQHGQKCRHFFPREPILLPLVATRPSLVSDEEKARMTAIEDIKEQVQKQLRLLHPFPHGEGEEDPVPSVLSLLRRVGEPPALLAGGGFTWAGVTFLPGQELDGLLQECSTLVTTLEDIQLLAVYHATLRVRRHSKYLTPRRVSEAYVVSHSPWITLAAQCNTELELVTHTPSKLISYVAKGVSQQSLHAAIGELWDRGGQGDLEAADRLEELVGAGWREVPLMEAFFRLDRRLFLSLCSNKVTWVNTSVARLVEGVHTGRYILR